MAKLIKFGEQVPAKRIYRFSERDFITGNLSGDPDGWVLEIDDLECISNAVKYLGWGLLSPEKIQGAMIPNADGHNTPKDFAFEQISQIELKLHVVAPDFAYREKAIREAKEAGIQIIMTDIPDVAKPYVKELKYDPKDFEEYEIMVPVRDNVGTDAETCVMTPVTRLRRKSTEPPPPQDPEPPAPEPPPPQDPEKEPVPAEISIQAPSTKKKGSAPAAPDAAIDAQ